MSKPLGYQQKLLLGIFLTLLLCCGTATLVTFWVIERNIYAMAHREMEFSAYGMHAMLQNMINVSARAYLQGRATALAQTERSGDLGFLQEHRVPLFRGKTAKNLDSAPCSQAIAEHGYGFFTEQTDPYREIRTKDAEVCLTWTWHRGNHRADVLYLDGADLPPLLALDQLDVALPAVTTAEDFFIFDRKTGQVIFSGNRKGHHYSPQERASGKPLQQLVFEDLARMQKTSGNPACCGSIAFIDAELQHHQDAIYRHIPDFDWTLVVLTDLEHVELTLIQLRWLMATSIVLTLLLTAWLLRKVLHSISADLLALLRYVEQVDGREKHTLHSQLGSDEIGRLGQAFLEMENRLLNYTGDLERCVAERTQALEEANRTLAIQALHDPLTGLANRRYFDQRLIEEIARANRNGPAFSLLLLDVDYFKKYNDHYGHPAGDVCLQNIAQALKTHFQRSNDFCARIGGEEFAVILPNTNLGDAQRLGDTLCQRVAAADWPHAQAPKGKVTLSGGLALWETGSSAEQLYKRSDDALYRAKANGRDNCQASTE